MHAPLARKTCHLFVVFTDDHFESAFGKFLTRLDHHRLLDEEAKATYYRLVIELSVSEYSSYDQADRIVVPLLLTRFEDLDSV